MKCFETVLLLLLCVWMKQVSGTSASAAAAFNLPLPGGRSISMDESGVVRIRFKETPPLPKAPPAGTLPLLETYESIQVRDTMTPKGYGAYCVKQPIAKDTFLGFYEGDLVMSRDDLEARYKGRSSSMDYVMSLDGGATFVDGYNRAQNRTVFSPVHLNHEDQGQAGCNCLRVLEDGNVAFFTLRDIQVGEELCFDYGQDFWKGRESQKFHTS